MRRAKQKKTGEWKLYTPDLVSEKKCKTFFVAFYICATMYTLYLARSQKKKLLKYVDWNKKNAYFCCGQNVHFVEDIGKAKNIANATSKIIRNIATTKYRK
eukprot:GEMP01134496.1.p1 GENE.GEMP01134496.1~~GEMP01134496.1.p1  ORF type:complete len:101 (-),score=2.17 GEMP01134496.1:90-392(-)